MAGQVCRLYLARDDRDLHVDFYGHAYWRKKEGSTRIQGPVAPFGGSNVVYRNSEQYLSPIGQKTLKQTFDTDSISGPNSAGPSP